MVLGECSEWLAGLGYSPGSAAGVVNVLERLSWWMQLAATEVDDIDEELLARFIAVEGLSCRAENRFRSPSAVVVRIFFTGIKTYAARMAAGCS